MATTTVANSLTQRVIGALALDPTIYEEVEADPAATSQALWIVVLSSLAATRVLAHQLYGVTPNDPVTLAGVATVVATASLIACYLPARRATAVDPMEALRHE